ncbi:flavoprotein, HI0933 family [Desulfitobacterium dichloroeliminans LMG P-21439]|uniref:Flavoprotein, HI0933 family n=1 Tax=Desulfitobacterium dichloroeliminans (strain LMG P-21439 / DCA1) TaxID=871963 RepID=L0FAZ5_DESDL|nr:NAD(P)/FAD-dependent oxidoreductase [Desulfitobacterium dichloroeliminans]AGA70190.1 flavoprotein, HI0933 family [Desulfitobacterium dichloroeliminans LMG P-21439]
MPKGKQLKVVVIGGGAAGLFAAVIAGRDGAAVTILERNQRVGKKILATGNGRCNLTNTDLQLAHYHGQNPQFAMKALQAFDNNQAIEFFEGLGIAHKVEEEGKVFPFSNQASSVLDVLRYEVERLGIEVVLEAEVKGLHKLDKGFDVQTKDGKKYFAHRVILATGGKAAPNLGSTGSGYPLAENMGHRLVEPFPALVQLKLAEPFLKQIKGIKFEGLAEILVKGKSLAQAQGELLFTEYGISGPPIFQLSRTAAEKLKGNHEVWVKVAMLPTWTKDKLAHYLHKRWQDQPEKSVHFSFVGFINKQLTPVVLKQAGIEDMHKPVKALTSREKEDILQILQDWRFQVTGTNTWTAAQVTAGGIDVRDINPATMESKLATGLYFAGEIMDIDGDCGGYNLQWAWSSAYLAGKSAADD